MQGIAALAHTELMTGKVTAHLLSSGKKAEFIAKSYVHLLGCIVAFILIELWFFRSGFAEPVAKALLSVSWLVVLGAYVLVAWFASLTAHAIQSRPGNMQGSLSTSGRKLLFSSLFCILLNRLRQVR